MKVIVSHSGKQYVNGLLETLQGQKLLLKHFTSFVPNKLKKNSFFVPRPLWSKLERYQLRSIPNDKIIHFPLLFLGIKLLKTHYCTTKFDLIFDQIVGQFIKRFDFDVIIGFENCNLATFKNAKKRGKVTILDLAQIHHEDIVEILEPFISAQVLKHELAIVNPNKESALQFTDYIFTLSSFATHSLVSRQFDRNRIFEINLGVNHQVFRLKEEYPKDGPVNFLFVGTVMRRKGISLLLKVWKELNLSNATLSIVGPLSDGKDLLQEYEHLVSYHPFLHHEELSKQYQTADVFLFPSYLDSWAQTVIEAMACGTPVIITENTGAKDAVQQGGGFIIPVNDAEALKEKILFFYHNRNEIERLGREAHRVAQQYTWENYQQQILKALQEIAHREGISF